MGIALLIPGCVQVPSNPPSQSALEPAPIKLPSNFADERPADEKSTSIKTGKASTTIVYGDDVEPNAMSRLLASIRRSYPDELATRAIKIRKAELVGIYRAEIAP